MRTTLTAGTASLGRIGAVTTRHLYVVMRSPHRIFDIAVWPIVDTVLYGSIAMFMSQANASTGATRTVMAIVGGIIMWHVVYQAQIAVSTGFFEEVYSRQLPSLLTTPLRPVEWLVGAALQGMLKVVIGVAAVATTAAVLYGFNITSAGAGIVPVMTLLLLTGWALAVLVVGFSLHLGSGTEALTYGLLFVILPLSGALYPVSALPEIVRPLSAVMPTRPVFDAARAVAAGGPTPWGQIGVAALATTGLVAASFGFAVWSLRAFQRRGFISRYQ
jgi:ABC-2 type transport system permease protein